MNGFHKTGRRAARASAAMLMLAVVAAASARADSICASVQIEIRQTLTLERQAFDATMKIDNGFAESLLTGVQIDVLFQDANGRSVSATSDSHNTNALFFIRENSLSGINATSNGTVDAATTAEIHWLIIPALGAAGSNAVGQTYFVGASLRYTLRGQEYTVEVAPDFILVKPMPKLLLDYFLPDTVYGDDPFTESIEPPVPYSLGLRVRNDGYGPAHNVRLETAQPEIVDNLAGLSIGFALIGCEVNGRTGSGGLLVSFGTIDSGLSGVARWSMISTMMGHFTNFDATITHADELGGELTSLIEDVRTHTLIHDVLVDLPGRDGTRDFLARDIGNYMVYESDSLDVAVTNLSPQAGLSLLSYTDDQRVYTLTTPPAAGALFAGVTYSEGGTFEIDSVVRADGKTLAAANSWVSKERDQGTDPWNYFLNIFDVNGGGVYRVTMRRIPVPDNQAPVLAYIGRKVTFEQQPLGFLVAASDPNGTIPELSVTGMPATASFVPNGHGQGTFTWTPPVGSAGVYPVRFMASDGEFIAWEIVRIYVGSPGEPLNAQGVPESQADWRVPIKDVDAYSWSGVATVLWDSVAGVLYEVFASDDPVNDQMRWSKIGATMQGRGVREAGADGGLGTTRQQRFYQIVLAGDAPETNGIWGVVRRSVPAGTFVMMSPALSMDRRFDGEFGRMLSDALDGNDDGIGGAGDEIYVLNADGSWRALYLDGEGAWREADGSVSTFTLPAGKGFFLRRAGGASRVTFVGPVGNVGTNAASIEPGWNILGLSEGKTLTVLDALASAHPLAGASEETSDILVLQNPDGSWRRMMHVQGWGPPYDGTWFDLSSFQIATNKLEPGAAYYYYRRPVGGSTEVKF